VSAPTSLPDHGRSPVRELGTALIGWGLAGWIVVYNVIRILTGDLPADVIWISLPIGAGLGIAAYLLVFRRVAAILNRRRAARLAAVAPEGPDAGRPQSVRESLISVRKPTPAHEGIDRSQEDALRLAVWSMAVFGLAALVMGVVLLADFLMAAAGDRPITSLVLGGWNVVAALWAADEIARIRVFDLDGLDFSVFMAAFTAVMASLGLARDFFPAGQIVLIVVSAIAGGLIGLAAWRLLPKRGVPILAPAAIMTCVVALLLGLFG
jgi:hypothetical protein